MRGHTSARHNAGVSEEEKGNTRKAIKHYTIAVKGGGNGSLRTIREMYTIGRATKDDYSKALQARQSYLDEVKSDQRDKAAAAREAYRYY